MLQTVLLIGSGGREHAIAWKLAQSPKIGRIYVTPNNSSIVQQVENAENANLQNINDFASVVSFCSDHHVTLVVIGPEDPLSKGLTDVLHKNGIRSVFGPNEKAARIETDKNWSKQFMDKYGIPTARWRSFTDADQAKLFIRTADYSALVVKACGLAAGKGVIVASNQQEACDVVDDILVHKKFGIAGTQIVIEEVLQGEEVSVLAFCDGTSVKLMLPVQDHKRIYDNDSGPNTGGMGAYCPCPFITQDQLEHVEKTIFQRALKGFQSEGLTYVGVLYAGLMVSATPITKFNVLEFNCRFGDPETEVLIPLMEFDIYDVMMACIDGTLNTINLKWRTDQYSVGVVLASKDYPKLSSTGDVILGLEHVMNLSNFLTFHCGTKMNDSGNLVTNGGRVLIIVNLAENLQKAALNATLAAHSIVDFSGKQIRKDIAHKGIARMIMMSGQMTYRKSGVDIMAGDELVNRLKSLTVMTKRPGLIGGLGGFGGLFDLSSTGYQDPLLVSGTDGVGTKLKVAQMINSHKTIGIDLVAMCVNDILAHGAEPLFFLDYFACGRLNVKLAAEIIEGICQGCQLAGCALIGGETAEMPSMYHNEDYDLAGFAVGIVERSNLLPKIKDIHEGDTVFGLPSSGLHSNGYSLVRKVIEMSNVKWDDSAPFSATSRSYGEELLTPTKIYVKPMMKLFDTGKIKAFAHITGGGLLENVPRILPNGLGVHLDASCWDIPPVFPWLAAAGQINELEMLRTFNCGIGAVFIVDKRHSKEIAALSSAYCIGTVIKSTINRVVINNFSSIMEFSIRLHLPTLFANRLKPKKRVAVLISGTGTNLQSLIDATLDDGQNIGAEIVLVISNKPNVKGLKRAEHAHIPTCVIEHGLYATRTAFDKRINDELNRFRVDIVCLAGFMRILTAELTNRWRGRMINIHPSLLPLFKGINAQKQALEAGVRVTGCSVHFVETEMDSGLIISQKTVPIEINDTVETLTERIKTEAERLAYPYALKLLATEKVRLNGNIIEWNL